MKKASKQPDVIVRDGKAVAVALPINKYWELLEVSEDIEELAYLSKARRRARHYRLLNDYLANTN